MSLQASDVDVPRRLSELERETSSLKRQLQIQNTTDSSPASVLLAAAQLDAMSRPVALPSTELSQSPSGKPIAPQLSAGGLEASGLEERPPAPEDPSEPTLPRRIEGLELDARTIDGIFDL